MMKGIASRIISHLCSQYIEKIDSSQLEIEIWGGKAHLENVRILENSFLAHQIPFKVKKGIIGSLTLTFPWSTLFTDPCVIDIENILLVGEIDGGDMTDQNDTIQSNISNNSNITEKSMFDGILTKVLDNLIINIRNIHIRIEALTNDINNNMAIGIMIPSIKAFTINELGEKAILNEHPMILNKKVEISEFSIYVDTHCEFISQSEFLYQMTDKNKNNEHQFIFNPFSFDAIYTYNFIIDANPQTTFSVNSNEIEIALEHDQYKGIQVLLEQYNLFCKQRLYRHCGRPSRPPRSDRSSTLWWQYSYRCALFKKEKKNIFEVDTAIEMLKNRTRYFEIYKGIMKNTISAHQLDEYEEQLDSKAVTLLRDYSSSLYSIQMNDISQSFTEEEKQAIIVANNSMQKGPIQFNIHLNALQLSLKETKNGNKITSFIVNNLQTQITKIKFNHAASITIDSFYIMNYMSQRYPKTLEVSNGINGSFTINYNEPYIISLNVSPVFGVVDVEWLAKIIKFFEKKRVYIEIEDESQSLHQIQSIIDSHIKFNLDLKIEKSHIIVPYQEIQKENQPVFHLNFNSFSLFSTPSTKYDLTDKNSLFDNYKLAVNEIEMVFCDRKMSNIFDINANLEVAIVTSDEIESLKGVIDVSPLELYSTTFQVLLLNELSLYLADTVQLNINNDAVTKTPENKLSVNLKSFMVSISYEEKQLYKLGLKNNFTIDITNKNKITRFSLKKEDSGLDVYEYFTGIDNGKLLSSEKVDLSIEASRNNQSINISLGKVDVYAKPKPLNFLLIFVKSPRKFERKLNYNTKSTIQEYIHQKCSQSNKQKCIANVQIKTEEAIGHLIVPNKESNELLTLFTNSVLINAKIISKEFEINVEISPPKITTTQLGELWKNIISENEMMSLPISITLKPSSISVSLESLKLNISPLMLLQVIDAFKKTVADHTSIFGNPKTMPYLNFDINLKNTVLNLIHNTDFRSSYEVTISTLTFKTITTPNVNQLIIDNVEIIQKTRTSISADSKFFGMTNLNLIVDMDYLLLHEIGEIFNSKWMEIGFGNWKQETVDFIRNEHNEKVLSDTYFYVCGISTQVSFEDLFCTYSHTIARDMSFIISNLRKLIHADTFHSIDDLSPQINDDGFKMQLKLNTKRIAITILNPNPIATMKLNQLSLNSETKEELYSVQFKDLNVIANHNEPVVSAGSFSLTSDKNEIKGKWDSLDLIIKFYYLPITIEYIMNCPFFSFLDEFNNHAIQATSFTVNKLISLDLSRLSVKFPIENSLFVFSTSFNALFNQNQQTAEIRNIQMILNNRSILNPYSIKYHNDVWSIDPVFASFSVFEFYILEQLFNSIKRLKMPVIYIAKKDVELAQRNFTITTSTIKFILTQPNLPFLILEIKPSTFLQTYDKVHSQRTIEYNIQLLVKHANYSTCGFDTIIDPFNVALKTISNKSEKTTDVKISPMNIALSTQFLKEILIFRKKFEMMKAVKTESNLFQNEHIFIQNDTGLPISLVTGIQNNNQDNTISLNENYERFILDSSETFQLNDFILKHDIFIEYLETAIHFSIKDLFFPLFFNGNSIAYMVADIGVQTIHFSSPFIIRNKLPFDIELKIGENSMGVIKSESNVPVPISMISSLSKGIRCAMSPATSSFSTPLIIKHYKSNSNLVTIVDNKSMSNILISVRSFVDRKHSVCYITYSSYLSIANHLPNDVAVIFEDNQNDFLGKSFRFDIKSDDSIDASFINQSKKSTKFKLVVDGFGESKMTAIYPFGKQASPTMFCIFDNNIEKCKIAVQPVSSTSDYSIQLVIFTPCVMYNKTNLPLLVKESQVTSEFVNNIYLYTPSIFFQKKKVDACLLYSDKTFSNKDLFDCMHPGTIQTILLPYKNNMNVHLMLSVVTKDAPIQFYKTTVVTIGPSLCVMNHFNETIYFKPSIPSLNDDFVNICGPNQLTSIIYSNENSQFDVYVEGYEKCQKVELIAQTTTVFRLLSQDANRPDFLIQLDVIKQQNGFCGHLSYPTLPTPFVITNMLENKVISAYQNDSLDHAIIIKSNTTGLFAMDQPFTSDNSAPQINLSINDGEVILPISYSSDTKPSQIKKTKYYYQVRTTKRGNQMIIVSENLDDFAVENKARKSTKYNFSLKKIQVSFIDELMNELFLLTVQSLTYQIDRKNSIQLSIDSIQLDDTCAAAKSPVVLCITHPKFVTASLESKLPLKARSFDSIDATFAQIHLFIDLAFVNDVYMALMELYRELFINTHYHPEEMLCNNEITEITFKSFAFYSISNLTIRPISFELNFRGSSGRPFIYPQSNAMKISLLRMVPNVSAAAIQIPAMVINHLRAPFSIIRHSFFEFYKNRFMKESFKILFHIDLLLNGPGIAKSIVSAITDNDKTASQKIVNIGSQILQTTEDAVRNVSTAFSLFKLDQKSKFINKCTKLLDKATDKISTAKQGLTDETIPPIQRISRAFPMGRIISLNPALSDEGKEIYDVLNNEYGEGNAMRFAMAQYAFQKSHIDDPYYSQERLIALIDPNRNANLKAKIAERALAVFDHYIAVLYHNLDYVLLETKITNISSIEQFDDKIIITSYDINLTLHKFEFICENEKEARSILMIITSIIERMKLYVE